MTFGARDGFFRSSRRLITGWLIITIHGARQKSYLICPIAWRMDVFARPFPRVCDYFAIVDRLYLISDSLYYNYWYYNMSNDFSFHNNKSFTKCIKCLLSILTVVCCSDISTADGASVRVLCSVYSVSVLKVKIRKSIVLK